MVECVCFIIVCALAFGPPPYSKAACPPLEGSRVLVFGGGWRRPFWVGAGDARTAPERFLFFLLSN